MTSQPELDFSVFPYRKFHRTPGDLPDQEVVPLEGDDHIARFLAITPPWHTGSVTWRRAFVSRMGGWHEGVSSWQDWEFALRALSLRPTYRCFPTPCFFVRGPSAAHRTISAQGWLAHHVRSWPVAMESAVEHLARGGLMTARRRALLTMLYLFVAERFVEIGDQVSADAMWSRARRLGLVSLPEHLLGGAILRVHGRVAEALRWTLRGAQEVRRIPAALLRERRPAARSLSSS